MNKRSIVSRDLDFALRARFEASQLNVSMTMALAELFFLEDVVYMEGEAERQEYVMAEDGLIWRGNHNSMRPTVWKYAQFERDILDCSLHLMNEVGKVRVSGRNDPVVITRCLSAAVSHGLLKGQHFFIEILKFFNVKFMRIYSLHVPQSFRICSRTL